MVECVTITEFDGATSAPSESTDISKSNNVVPMSERPVCFITARVHPGESNASWVLKVHFPLQDVFQGLYDPTTTFLLEE